MSAPKFKAGDKVTHENTERSVLHSHVDPSGAEYVWLSFPAPQFTVAGFTVVEADDVSLLPPDPITGRITYVETIGEHCSVTLRIPKGSLPDTDTWPTVTLEFS